jgi:hypothetical protein
MSHHSQNSHANHSRLVFFFAVLILAEEMSWKTNTSFTMKFVCMLNTTMIIKIHVLVLTSPFPCISPSIAFEKQVSLIAIGTAFRMCNGRRK